MQRLKRIITIEFFIDRYALSQYELSASSKGNKCFFGLLVLHIQYIYGWCAPQGSHTYFNLVKSSFVAKVCQKNICERLVDRIISLIIELEKAHSNTYYEYIPKMKEIDQKVIINSHVKCVEAKVSYIRRRKYCKKPCLFEKIP